jgi:hypothetical protein
MIPAFLPKVLSFFSEQSSLAFDAVFEEPKASLRKKYAANKPNNPMAPNNPAKIGFVAFEVNNPRARYK